jgi:signal transduction histidine kinase
MQEALESKKSFVRYISHEVRTPLNTVSLGLDLLIEELEADYSARSRDYIDSATELKQAAGIAVEILNDLLQYDKLSDDTLQIHREPHHALDLIDETINTFKIQVLIMFFTRITLYGVKCIDS